MSAGTSHERVLRWPLATLFDWFSIFIRSSPIFPAYCQWNQCTANCQIYLDFKRPSRKVKRTPDRRKRIFAKFLVISLTSFASLIILGFQLQSLSVLIFLGPSDRDESLTMYVEGGISGHGSSRAAALTFFPWKDIAARELSTHTTTMPFHYYFMRLEPTRE